MFIFTPSFLSYPATQQVEPDEWIPILPYAFIRPSGERIIVPAAGLGTFEEILGSPVWSTDYGSIPKVFQNIFPPDGELAPIYVVHDWIYASEMFSRDVCDEILLEGAKELGYNDLERNVIYSAVRLGGGEVWAKHDPINVVSLQAYYNAFLSEVPARWPELLKSPT